MATRHPRGGIREERLKSLYPALNKEEGDEESQETKPGKGQSEKISIQCVRKGPGQRKKEKELTHLFLFNSSLIQFYNTVRARVCL